MTNYELAEKDYKAGMKYKEIAEKYGVTLNTVKSWKTRYWNNEKNKKVCTQNKKSMHTKKVKEIAKNLIESGASISEVANQTELNISTIKRLSVRNNLQAKQLENLQEFKKEHLARIKANKLKRLAINEEALEAIGYEIGNWQNNGKISKAAMEKLLMNEEVEQQIFEVERMIKLEKLKIDKEIKQDPNISSDRKITIKVVK